MTQEAFEILGAERRGRFVFLCEHASNHIPTDYGQLGLSDDVFDLHVAYDIGTRMLTEALVESLDSPAVCARFSRLLVDANRAPDHPGLIPDISDGIVIPGNVGLTPEARQDRLDRFYEPFHQTCEDVIGPRHRSAHLPILVSVHSFTPKMNGETRPWPVAVLWKEDRRLAGLLHQSWSDQGIHVGDNQPYSGQQLFYTMERHGEARGLIHVALEVRQNEIDTPSGVAHWVDILSTDLAKAADHLLELADQ